MNFYSRSVQYDRKSAVDYAHKWAYRRNPRFYDFSGIGGDCTNFTSQVLFAGSRVMNYIPTYGWYYSNLNNRTPSWTGVEFLHNYLIRSNGVGPFAEKTSIDKMMEGDIIQLSFNTEKVFEHSLVVVRAGAPASYNNILVATHSYDRDNYSLLNYSWMWIRFIHVIGVRM